MTTERFTVHLYWSEIKRPYGFDIYSSKIPAAMDWLTYVGPVEVDVPVPELEQFDPRAAKLAAKLEELTKVRAEMTARVTQLMREINQLQAIEMEANHG